MLLAFVAKGMTGPKTGALMSFADDSQASPIGVIQTVDPVAYESSAQHFGFSDS